ncbi:hypothetical protein GCM10025734_03580 [Kitasatospora paranensis]|uniref:DnaB-like helicase N-terminal domain-containing protein n=1 Tax=Kitasatospora paranensis TaxID=258053 RepID=UPI0031F09A1A
MAWLAADAVPDPSLVVDYGQVVAGAAVDRPLGEDGESSEQALLAALMTQPAAARDLCGWLRAEDFGDERLGRIYAVLVEQELRNEPQIAGRGRVNMAGRRLRWSWPASSRLPSPSSGRWIRERGQRRGRH